ncbi:17.2 kDa class II heat shock protein [Phalaenopsis equestris]|uniref:17.2 kDa class II heat shock protein n=1 Tax=Phalaenopsis equestris TaxID=78828 RepID=UPI0009E65BDC|nr:17.2 kDa class II heat shock protein [Phalaenopsis equestris]
MEHTTATRRIRRILDHVLAYEAILSPTSHLSAMNCSSTLNSMAGRSDNRLLYAPRDSVSQAGFIHHDSVKEEEPLFSRKARESCSFPDSRDIHLSKQASSSSSTEAVKFAGKSDKIEKKSIYSRTSCPSISNVDTGLVWSPRIDVAESSSSYVVIVELPGVNINGIRVEVDDQNLTITGKRILHQQWRTMNSSADSNVTYHHKEILQGPYEVIWPLPKNINRDQISAEFVDGFLQIVVPKISTELQRREPTENVSIFRRE